MKNLQDATERICELKGSLLALDALVLASLRILPTAAAARLQAALDAHAEAARTALLHADISDVVLASFERDMARHQATVRPVPPVPDDAPPAGVDALLLATTRVSTYAGDQPLTSASGFFYRAGARLFLVSNRHVFADPGSAHRPDRVDIGVHTDLGDLTRYTAIPVALYQDGRPLWREASDAGGAVDIAAIEVPPGSVPADAVLQAFDQTHLDAGDERIVIGDALTIAGFPLGFHDTLHFLAVTRSASIASAYGVRFQGQGCFLTDARTHRGSSGSPVVRRRVAGGGSVPSWQLVGVHSTRMDMRTRDQSQDESLGLNCAWYVDVLPALTR